MNIGPHDIAAGGRVLYVAEEGNANDGDPRMALRMVRTAAAAGADAIEFQLVVADEFYVRSHPLYGVFKKREFPRDTLMTLAEEAHRHNILIAAAPLATSLVSTLADVGFDYFNVNATDLTNPRMLDAVAATGLPFMVSTALGRLDEIDWAVQRVSAVAEGRFCLLHGQHIMATMTQAGVPVERTSLATIRFLEDRYGVPVGFVDHTNAVEVGALAAAHGAAVVTKHLAPRAGWRGPDWIVCLDPDAMRRSIELVRLAEQVRGVGGKHLAQGEAEDRLVMRRSIVAARDLPTGAVLDPSSLALKRPGVGLDPIFLDRVEGRRLRRAVSRDEPLRQDDIDGMAAG